MLCSETGSWALTIPYLPIGSHYTQPDSIYAKLKGGQCEGARRENGKQASGPA